jgi:hypothetical protein
MVRPFAVVSQRHNARCCQGAGSSDRQIGSRSIVAAMPEIGWTDQVTRLFTVQASRDLSIGELDD